MSTPRKTDRVSLARHRHPPSPFGRAEDASHEFEFENNLVSPPSKQNGTRPRHNYRTGTLAGAYRAVSRTSTSDEGIHLGSTSSPRHSWNNVYKLSPTSDNSNPPEELVDAYKRIEEDGTLADYVQWDDGETSSGKRSSGRLSRSSSRQREREYNRGAHDSRAFSEGGFLDETTFKSPSGRTTDYSRDEQRLRRVTGKDSPIFSKAAKTTSRAALTADNLQRREDEDYQPRDDDRHHQGQHTFSEHDGENGPSLNLPRTWGSRAARRQEWLRNVSGGSGSDTKENAKERERQNVSNGAPASNADADADGQYASRPGREPPRVGRASAASSHGALEERVANLRTHTMPEPKEQAGLGLSQNATQPDGDAIPNTPIVVFKNSTLNKNNTAKRDSQELLRRLSRTESPKLDQIQTPDPPKLFQRQIHDKTPRVTGAWIDTPMTERAAAIPEDLTKDIVPVKAKEDTASETKPAASAEIEVRQDNNIHAVENKTPSPEPINVKKPRLRSPLARPKLPKSALETVIEDASSGKEALDLGDDTIESLQAIMDDQTELKTEEEEEAAYEQKVLDGLELARQNSEGSDDYDRIESKLQSLTKHITEVKKGLDRLQGHVTNGFEDLDAKQDAVKTQHSTSASTSDPTSKSSRSSNTPSDSGSSITIPIPRLWKRSLRSQRLQPTKLGWATFILLSWYITECTMTEMYAHPLISDRCTGYCLRPDAPKFPFVTVTMLWRWSRLSTLLAPIFTIAIALFRLVAQLLGLWDGYVDDPDIITNFVGEIRINGTAVAVPWLTPPAKTQGFMPPSDIPPPPPPLVWTPRNEEPMQSEDDRASMDDDEYL
ncbi:hypothetical protein PENSTE_c003G04706 [Penicillium steckii]|uniref:Uncharacterized protein n=1 Tax=Penicillium steckii TaxID=303698 RepID=A0A1V6TRF9_9EURO|nr:hypothetical protein PENSTE_c003G04706 [Penicillium steckii]